MKINFFFFSTEWKDSIPALYKSMICCLTNGAERVGRIKYTDLKEHLEKNGEIIKEQLRTRKYKPQPVCRASPFFINNKYFAILVIFTKNDC